MGSSYDRAVRDFTFQKATGTGNTLGPGSYTDHRGSMRVRSEGYAPFSSLASRDTFLTPGDSVAAAPGPGQYDIDNKEGRFQKAPVMGTEPRFRYKKDDLPGPGKYETVTQWKRDNPRTKPPVISNSKLKFERKMDAPSIPVPKDAYGYEEGDHGQLIRQAPPPNDGSLGPAFYNPTITDSLVSRKYKGCHWSKQKGPRQTVSAHEGPGPADYDPCINNFQKDLTDKLAMHTMGTRAELNVPRYVDWVVKQSQKAHVPGPGAYENNQAAIKLSPNVYNDEGVLVEHPPFGIGAKRFNHLTNSVPAPGAYNDPRHALSGLHKLTGMKKNPFSQTDVRFRDNRESKLLPGPGAYTVDQGIASNSLKVAYQSSTRKGGFGSTASRSAGVGGVGGPATELPGPGAYDIPAHSTGAAARYTQPLSAPFASLTRREYDPGQNDIHDKPPIGAYNVSDSFAKSQGRRQPEPPRNEEARKRNQSFNISAPRFNGKLFSSAGMAETPGPGAYDYSSVGGLRKMGGKMVTMSQRFGSKTDESPGPGQYELSPGISNTVLKNTYNVSLNNPLITIQENTLAEKRPLPSKQSVRLTD